MKTSVQYCPPRVAAPIKPLLDQLAGLARPLLLPRRRARDPLAYAAALEVLG